MRLVVAFACLVAGVFVLAGLGWALVTTGALVWLVDDRSVAWLTERRKQFVSAPRRAIASVAMGAGLVLAPIGVILAAGLGVGLAVGGLALVGFSVLFGWGA